MYLSNIECINSILVGAKLKINILTANTFPANRRSPPCSRLDTSLLSAAQQGAECRSASKVMFTTDQPQLSRGLGEDWQELAS